MAWIGLVIVTQNVVGSLFNSFLFDFTEGWLYVVGFGVAAGMVLRERDAARCRQGRHGCRAMTPLALPPRAENPGGRACAGSATCC